MPEDSHAEIREAGGANLLPVPPRAVFLPHLVT
jgi:hypothetical protein